MSADETTQTEAERDDVRLQALGDLSQENRRLRARVAELEKVDRPEMITPEEQARRWGEQMLTGLERGGRL
jgi:hypothetical protein